MAGYLRATRPGEVEVVPVYFATTNPSGTITEEAFERICGELTAEASAGGPWDGVLLALHGAAVSERFADADGELARRVRALVGPGVPIGLTLDMHANISQAMIDAVTATVVYRTNPHIDASDRAYECASLIVRTIRQEITPVQHLETPPMVINIVRQSTQVEPMVSVIRDLGTVLNSPGVLSASVAEGYPYADVEDMGMAFVVIRNGDPGAARDAAKWLARRSWNRRTDFVGEATSPEEGLRAAACAPTGPIVLLDVGDNIGGGAPGDSTVLLAEAKRQGVRDLLVTLYDPEAAKACATAGVGRKITLSVGGKADSRHGAPVQVTGIVRCLSDGKFEDANPTHGGDRFFDAGLTAVLRSDDSHTLVLTSKLVPNTSLQQMLTLGIDPRNVRIIVAKGVNAPRAAYEPIAAEMVMVDTPGVTTMRLEQFEYHSRRTPLFPFELDAAYE
jgi:microcystin degradation protein MlrC